MMAFFVVADERGTAIFKYPDRDDMWLKPGEKLIGRGDTLADAERIEFDYLEGTE